MKKLLSLLLLIILFSCGTSKISIDQNIDADIYIDGKYKGKNIVEISKFGTPKKYKLLAKNNGVEIGQMNIRRNFDYKTLLIGYFTYGIGLYAGWSFPDKIIIPTNIKKNSSENEWITPKNNVWMQPINN